MEPLEAYKRLAKELATMKNEIRSYENENDLDIPVLEHINDLRMIVRHDIEAMKCLVLYYPDMPRLEFNYFGDVIEPGHIYEVATSSNTIGRVKVTGYGKVPGSVYINGSQYETRWSQWIMNKIS